MNNETATLNAHQAENLKAFLNQVPERVNAILENWHQLVQGDWNAQLFNSLLERLHALIEASDKFSVSQIQTSGLTLISDLDAYCETKQKPRHEDLVILNGLIQAFRDAAFEACQSHHRYPVMHSESSVSLSNPGLVYLIGLDDPSVPGLRQALQARQLRVETLTALEPIITYPESPAHRLAVIAHTDRLKELYPDSRDSGLWQTDSGLPGIPVAFIAPKNDLQLRLEAMRTDARAYWTQPVDPEQVADRMLALMSPQRHIPYRILIVEDDPAQADFASAILRKAHFECRIVTDPLQIMQSLSLFRPDLILMDLYMPGADGSELTTVIREQSEFVDIPVVFLSGEQDRDKQLHALSCGGEDFLSKPIGPNDLITTVTNRIRRAQQLNDRLTLSSPTAQPQAIGNREFLFDRVDALLKTRTTDGPQYAVLYLDIDQADDITRQIGIGSMDVLLSEIGKRLQRVIRPQDRLGRLGDHSLGIVANYGTQEALEAFGHRLCEAVARQPIKLDDQTLKVAISIGANLLDDQAQDARSLFSNAEFASKTAHKAGGSQLYLQQTEPAGSVDSSGDPLVKLILESIEQRYLEIYFQPIVALKSAANEAHYQALIRLQEPDGKLHTAAEFVPVAERIGFIGQIDHWITRKAVALINREKKQGQQLHLFVSQAADLLDNIERLSWLKEMHRRGVIAAGDLTFEFRLGDMFRHLDSAKVCFDMLHSIQIMTLLTGFDNSAEAQRLISTLPFDFVKLHASLLRKPDHNLLGLISSLQTQKLKVIAPQVEDPRSIALLWSSGVDFVQGNFVQRPESNLLYDFNESVLN